MAASWDRQSSRVRLMNGRRSVWWGRERGPRVLLNDPRGPAAVQLKPWDFFFRPETMLLLLLLPELQLPPWGGGAAWTGPERGCHWAGENEQPTR